MKKEIREVKDGIVRVTTTDERWYARPIKDAATGLPTYQFVPSVTWIAEHYPKGVGFYKWLANTGWDEAQALKEAAGDKGSKVHNAIQDYLDFKPIDIDMPYLNNSTGQPEPLTLEEYQAILSFETWYLATKPVFMAQDIVVWNDTDNYAGTVDFLYRLGDQLWLIDFKTSKSIWPSHRMQVSAYKHANPEWKDAKLGILQLGYERNQLGYKFTEVEDCYDLFLSTKRIWAEETKGQKPAQKDYPLRIQLSQPASAGSDGAVQGTTVGGGNGEDSRGTEAEGVRKAGGGRVADGNRGRSPVRRSASLQDKK